MGRKKRLLAAAVCTIALTSAGGSVAYAQGQVERGPEHARSICSYSGLNDDPNAPAPEGGRTQSYGQHVRQGDIVPAEVRSGPPSPGFFCNPNNLSLK
ncbi:hypothetical protein E0L93_03240 [Rubrobacter taiwanensis]|uniref:Uncharacterized protein n=1 Tax=Rubrobacter taiwanensis TaxID=185139 RepID=A0A4R1BRX8_9ACTN|nr:hypothetical protein [Rubrobacter taiwanensis]TCJ19975.1 hypothetical protein E0L93_03240 [Rubrobacter taiwanensis]